MVMMVMDARTASEAAASSTSPPHTLVSPEGDAFQIDGNMGALNGYQVGGTGPPFRHDASTCMESMYVCKPRPVPAHSRGCGHGVLRFCCCCCLQEMLVQSRGAGAGDEEEGSVWLLPALPPEWPSGRVSGWVTRARLVLLEMTWAGTRSAPTSLHELP
jgi:hypothetical protein